MSNQDSLEKRRQLTGGNLSLGYRNPLKIVRGEMQYLFDETGRRYLDAYNNVPQVGHCHPEVVEAACEQMRTLNTNTRYLSDHFNEYAEALLATMPAALDTCFFLNSASEANELALRLSRTATGNRDTIVAESAYHGHTTTLIDLSPYKHDGPGGTGAPDWVHTVPNADTYRGVFRGGDAARRYAQAAGDQIAHIQESGMGLAAFMAETYPSVGGQIIPPDGYLSEVYQYVRQAGGICIADEVQTCYGRIGNAFYAFEQQGVVPDIVVLGKPIGNGHPLAAVITRGDLADSFDNGMEFFSTFGGSTLSCVIGKKVLEVTQREGLQQHAATVGQKLLEGFKQLKHKHPLIGDVRGAGLFLGIELVVDRDSLEPAASEASEISNALKDAGILIGTDGPHHNVLKIRPPMPFDDDNADELLSALDQVLEGLQS
ncbi:MAG: aminotransferase class III-fold pyridoxal phosphate-dependent enzyme [Akkermansiaceae bacterium]